MKKGGKIIRQDGTIANGRKKLSFESKTVKIPIPCIGSVQKIVSEFKNDLIKKNKYYKS